MKQLLFILLSATFFAGCNRNVGSGPQTAFEGEDPKTGLVTILVSGTGEEEKTLAAGKNILENIAARRAFEQLLFIGLPNSVNYRLPLTPDMNGSTDSNPFLKNFFESRDYRRFIVDMHAVSKDRSYNNRNSIRFSVTINGDAFRKYLEQNKQVRAFGY